MERGARKTQVSGTRDEEFREMLRDRRLELLDQLRYSIRHVRTSHGRGVLDEVRDAMEHSGALLQEDLDMALLQLKTETLEKIEEALVRLDERSYGRCYECGQEIARQRLASLPFAVRCTPCQEAKEAEARAAVAAARALRRRTEPEPED